MMGPSAESNSSGPPVSLNYALPMENKNSRPRQTFGELMVKAALAAFVLTVVGGWKADFNPAVLIGTIVWFIVALFWILRDPTIVGEHDRRGIYKHWRQTVATLAVLTLLLSVVYARCPHQWSVRVGPFWFEVPTNPKLGPCNNGRNYRLAILYFVGD
jgi:xanthine/uracil permease